MQNTTADYKLEINKPSRAFESKITIGNNIYTNEELVNLIEEYAQPQEGFAIGNTISQSLDLTLLNRGDIIYSTSQIKVEIGLKIGDKIEYIPMGIFNIDDIEKTDYTTKFTAYDNMIKFETAYFSSLGDKPTLKQVVNELSQITGVEFIGSLPDYNVSKLEGFTCREVLSYVASICGGNAFITRDGKFTIKSLSEVEKSIDGNNYFDYTREEVKYKVGQISCQVDENNILSKGSTGTDSMELEFENPWVTENILNDLYNKLNGSSYLGYSMKWQGDLSLDPYDIITVKDIKNVVRKIPILSQKLSYTGGVTSEIGAKGETKNKNSFSSSGSTTNKVNRLVTEQAVIKEALIDKANIKDLEAVSIRTQTLEAKTAKIEEAIIDVAHISDLNAINANIQNLIAADATINNALINKADITELNAVKGTINSLDSKIANIETLVNGNLSSENIQAGGITSDKLTIANGFITNAMIASLDVSKINSGDISTNKFRIVSSSGKMLISDNTIQIRDNNRVRVQIGKDASNDYNMYVWDSSGKLMFDATGLKADGIKNKIIRDDMISDNANIDGSKINISSLITEINKDSNTTVIKSSKVQLDTVGQTLEVAFNSLKSNVDNIQIGGRNLIIKKDAYSNKYLDMTGNLTENSTTDTMKEYIKVKPGEVLTFQKENPDEYFRYNWYDVDKQFISRRPDKNNVFQWIVPENAYYIWVSYPNTGNVKVEKGNKPTDFSPAPEDVEGSIESVKQITESNSTTINVMQGQINTAINNTQIVKDGQTILLKDDYNRTVSKVDSINSTIGTHTTKLNELTGSISSVDTKVNSVQRDLEGTKSTVSSHTSQINGLNSTVSTQGSSISQLQTQIALKVEATDITTAINNISIGGRNLWIEKNLINAYESNGNATSSTSQHKMMSTYTDLNGAKYVTVQLWNPNSINNNSNSNRIAFYDSNKTWISSINTPKPNGTNYVSGIITVPTNAKYMKIGMITGSSQHESSIKIKVELGNKATDWTPSPEDIDNAITSVDSKVTTTNNKVATIETNLSSITQRVSSTESTVSTHTTQLGTVDSRINTAKNSAISTAASDATSKANNALTNAKSYTDGQITTVNQTITNKVAEIKTTTDSIAQRVSSTESKVTTINGNITNLTSRVSTAESKLTATSLTTTISSAISGGTSSISTTQFVMDKNGLTINNGALTIKNKSGTTVLNSDTNGNLIVTGTIKSQSGDMFVSLDSGGISLQDWNKKEQMLRIGISYFSSDRNYNGTTFAMPLYADFLRFSHISKADLTSGWSSTDTQYNFLDFWSDTRTINGTTFKKGINIYAPAYINNGLFFNNTSSNVTSDIKGNLTWNNGSGNTNNLLAVCGDNGLFLGYKSGETYQARIVLTEGPHPGTGDNIRSWGNWNLSEGTIHNGHFNGKSLTISGSKNCLQETKNYGSRLINAYETAEYYFGDLGFGKISEDGECLIYIEDIFSECINTNVEYHIFTQAYNGSIKTIERYKTYFKVKGDPGTKFSWEFKAKRTGFENNRLDLQDIETPFENGLELFGEEDFKVKTSEDALLNSIAFELENLLLMEE